MTETPQSPGIKAPEHLVEGQNFYDQSPFATILQDVSAKTHVDVARLRRLLTSLSREYSRPYRRGELPEGKLTARELSTQMQNVSSDVVYRSGFVGLTEHEAIRMLGTPLQECPLWSDYIASRLKGPDYADDGTPVPKIGKYLPMTSYATWVTHTLTRTNRAQVLGEIAKFRGLGDILPGGFSPVSPPGIPSERSRRGKGFTAP